jgi:hypothetical protein
MKNASCHDEKMEAYCDAVRALEDKFYGIKLNHVPHKYNEEADELPKIALGRITIPPNVFARDVAKPSVDLRPSPSSQEGPSGGSLESSGRGAHGRGPLERSVRALLARGLRRR